MAKKTTRSSKASKKSTTPKAPDPIRQAMTARARKLRKLFKSQGQEAFLITNPVDIRYLTGFSGEDSWLLVTSRQLYVLSDFRFEEEITKACPWVKLILRTKKMSDTLKELVADLKLGVIGFQSDIMTVNTRQTLGRALKGVKLKPTVGWLFEQRSIKDELEVGLIRKAIQIQEKAYSELLENLSSGVTEKAVAAQLEYMIKSLGADGLSFDMIVAAEPNGSLPHATPGLDKFKKNKSVLFDWGAKYQGYCGDLTRVIALGKMPKKIQEIYKIVLEAQEAAIAAIAPGMGLAEVDAVARDIIKEAGYGPQFGHSLGHGIGLDIHEEPRLASSVKGVLEVGMVVTVEPGIYLPDIGGVRIEDDVLVTSTGYEVLSSLPKSLESAMI